MPDAFPIWVVKNADRHYLIGFKPDGRPVWDPQPDVDVRAAQWTTDELAARVVPALSAAEIDVWTVERHS